MEAILLFFTAAVTAFAVENPVFARGLGISRDTLFINRPSVGILYGVVLTWLVTLSSVFAALVNLLIPGAANSAWGAPSYFAGVALVYVGTYVYASRRSAALFRQICRALPLSTFNSALFGAFYIASTRAYGVSQTIGAALGTGVGYTAALMIVYYARKRLAISPIPRSFRGLPALLIYIGFLSLAIYGLIGHGLPS